MEPISLAIAAGSAIFGAIGSGRARREAMKRERAAAARLMALEANRQDIPDFGTDFENPFANLQVATRAAEMQAEQADISLASTLDTLRATGASAGGATALARAAAQRKRGVSAQIQQQEARNAQLRAQGEVQAQQLRQRAQIAGFSAQERREMQQLNRQASMQSSASQQAAAYGAQSSAMIGAAVGALGSFAASGGFGAEGPFARQTPVEKFGEQTAVSQIKPAGLVDVTPKMPGVNDMVNPGLTQEDLKIGYIPTQDPVSISVGMPMGGGVYGATGLEGLIIR